VASSSSSCRFCFCASSRSCSSFFLSSRTSTT
jgi:hypothetical protein